MKPRARKSGSEFGLRIHNESKNMKSLSVSCSRANFLLFLMACIINLGNVGIWTRWWINYLNEIKCPNSTKASGNRNNKKTLSGVLWKAGWANHLILVSWTKLGVCKLSPPTQLPAVPNCRLLLRPRLAPHCPPGRTNKNKKRYSGEWKREKKGSLGNQGLDKVT